MCWDAARSPDLASTSKAPSHSGMEQWLCFLVRFTVTGIVRRSHPIPLTRAHLASRRATARLRLLIRLSRLLYLRRERMSMKERGAYAVVREGVRQLPLRRGFRTYGHD